MNSRLLYYPNMLLPDGVWLRQVLLYCDKIASIVPYGIDLNYRHLKILEYNDVYEPLHPEDFLYENKLSRESFENDVLSFFESDSKNKFTDDYISKNSRNNSQKKNRFLLHESKISFKIKQFLKESELIHNSNGDWNELDDFVCFVYMSLLAKHMGFENEFFPATDKHFNEAIIFDIEPSKTHSHSNPVMHILFHDCLPVPDLYTPIEKIIKFKEKRRDELLLFRKKIREFKSKIANIETTDELLDIKESFEDEMEMELNLIKRLFHDMKIPFRLDSFKGLSGIKSTPDLYSLLSIGSVANYIYNPKFMNLVLSASVTLGFSYTKNIIEAKKKIKSSPFSYVFYTRNFLSKTKHTLVSSHNSSWQD